MPELPVSPAGRRYGAFRSAAGPQDFGFDRFKRMLVATGQKVPVNLPSSTNNRQFCGPVRDQGSEGSCTGHAGRGMRVFLARQFQKDSSIDFSPADIYYLEREADGSLGQGDCGSTGRTCVQVLNSKGACPEGDDPYVAGDFNTPPSATALADGLKWRAGAYHSLTNVSDMKDCMASGYGFIVGFGVYSSLESNQVAETGLMPVPKTDEQSLGGHEVFFVDYDDSITCPGASAGAFLVQNSWGTGWGQNGFFWFPYQLIADPNVFMDAFIQHMGRPW